MADLCKICKLGSRSNAVCAIGSRRRMPNQDERRVFTSFASVVDRSRQLGGAVRAIMCFFSTKVDVTFVAKFYYFHYYYLAPNQGKNYSIAKELTWWDKQYWKPHEERYNKKRDGVISKFDVSCTHAISLKHFLLYGPHVHDSCFSGIYRYCVNRLFVMQGVCMELRAERLARSGIHSLVDSMIVLAVTCRLIRHSLTLHSFISSDRPLRRLGRCPMSCGSIDLCLLWIISAVGIYNILQHFENHLYISKFYLITIYNCLQIVCDAFYIIPVYEVQQKSACFCFSSLFLTIFNCFI